MELSCLGLASRLVRLKGVGFWGLGFLRAYHRTAEDRRTRKLGAAQGCTKQGSKALNSRIPYQAPVSWGLGMQPFSSPDVVQRQVEVEGTKAHGVFDLGERAQGLRRLRLRTLGFRASG